MVRARREPPPRLLRRHEDQLDLSPEGQGRRSAIAVPSNWRKRRSVSACSPDRPDGSALSASTFSNLLLRCVFFLPSIFSHLTPVYDPICDWRRVSGSVIAYGRPSARAWSSRAAGSTGAISSGCDINIVNLKRNGCRSQHRGNPIGHPARYRQR